MSGEDDVVPGLTASPTHNEVGGTVFGHVVQARTLIGDINLITGVPVRTRYLEQVRRIAPAELLDRDQELADLAQFCSDPATVGRYLWWRAKAWSGKSALLSWFVIHPPTGVRIVSFFITARLASQNDRAAFIDNLLEQLLAVLGQSLPPFLTDATREAHLLGLLADAASACQARDEQFVLVVDGLDEDRGAHGDDDWHSIAGLLPDVLPTGMRVIAAGRTDPPLPEDVPPLHPLRDPAVHRTLSASRHAGDLSAQMRQDLTGLLRGSQLGRDLLGLVVAAGGGLSQDDLVELTECAPWEVGEHLKTVAGRSFARRVGYYQPEVSVYLLAHEDLQATARDQLGNRTLTDYRERLHEWAQTFRDRHWPQETPDYLLRGYPEMLAAAEDLARLAECVTDRDRQERLLAVSGGDSVSLSEIVKAIDLCAAAPTPDLNVILRLAQHRDRLRRRNDHIPPVLPAAWVPLGETDRAIGLARSITDRDQRIQALQLVAEAISHAGDNERALALLREVAELIRSVESGYLQQEALKSLARTIARTGDHDWAETIARSVTDADEQAKSLVLVAQTIAQAGDYPRAVALVHSVTDPERQLNGLTSLAATLSRAGHHEQAMALLAEAQALVDSIPIQQAGSLLSTAAAIAQIAQPDNDELAAFLLEVVPGLTETTHNKLQTRVLPFVAETMIRTGDHERAEEIARSITDPDVQASVLRSVAEAVAQTGDHQRAEVIASSIAAPVPRVRALALVAQTIASSGEHGRASALLDQAESLIPSLSDHFERWWAAEWVAIAAAHVGDHDRAAALVQSITDLNSHENVLQEVAEATARAGDHDRAEAIARSITAHARRAEALRSVAAALAQAGHHDRAARVARSITDLRQQALTLWAVAEALTQAGARDQAIVLLGEAVEVAHSISDPATEASALESVAAAMTRVGERDRALALLNDAAQMAGSITDPFFAAKHLASVAEAIAQVGDHDRAEAIARSITDPFRHVAALASVASAIAQASDHDRALALLHDAEQTTTTLNGEDLIQAMRYITAAMIQMGEHDRAQAFARSIAESLRHIEALALLYAAIAQAGDHDRALALLHDVEQIADSFHSRRQQARALRFIAASAVEAGDYDRAEAIARSIAEPAIRAETLALVAEVIARAGNRHRALSLLDVAEEFLRSDAEPFQRTPVLTAMVTAMAQTGDHQRTMALVRSITDPVDQAQALHSIIDLLEPDRKVYAIAQQLKLWSWYRASPELFLLAPEAFEAGVRELRRRSST